jgi:YD repeat-containing protein
VRYGYDGIAPAGCTPPSLTFANAIGRRTQMCDAAGGEAWSYDSMGRVVTSRRVTNGVTRDFTYTYNLDGSLATLTYPSGRVITYTSNAAGRALSAVDTANSTNYATDAAYAPSFPSACPCSALSTWITSSIRRGDTLCVHIPRKLRGTRRA